MICETRSEGIEMPRMQINFFFPNSLRFSISPPLYWMRGEKDIKKQWEVILNREIDLVTAVLESLTEKFRTQKVATRSIWRLSMRKTKWLKGVFGWLLPTAECREGFITKRRRGRAGRRGRRGRGRRRRRRKKKEAIWRLHESHWWRWGKDREEMFARPQINGL